MSDMKVSREVAVERRVAARMEPRGRERHRWANREVEWSFWEKRHRRQSREGSGERAGKRASFKWAGAHESISTKKEQTPNAQLR